MYNDFSRRIKMSPITSQLIYAGVLFLFTLLSGVWLSHSGRPLHTVIFTIHKFIALAFVIVIASSVNHLYTTVGPKQSVELLLIAASALFFLALFVSGAILSRAVPPPEAILKVHQLVPLLALGSSTFMVYLLANSLP
jgi:hypothetical protein